MIISGLSGWNEQAALLQQKEMYSLRVQHSDKSIILQFETTDPILFGWQKLVLIKGKGYQV